MQKKIDKVQMNEPKISKKKRGRVVSDKLTISQIA
jgi:hypothetical protein